eukprot:scaffold324545_cov20-Prasinocladus_malaysianus.AAC.1
MSWALIRNGKLERLHGRLCCAVSMHTTSKTTGNNSAAASTLNIANCLREHARQYKQQVRDFASAA